MIKYKLICKDCDLKFDSWFASSNEYERLKKKKLLNCHKCNSVKVEKTIMAPQLISQNFKNDKKINFAYEARSIHYNGKKKSKGIYGRASKKDLKELKEEGIDAQMIPWIAEKEN